MNTITITTNTGETVTGCAYKERYVITHEGKVYSYWTKLKKWKEQKPRPHTNGYSRAMINLKDEYIHRIVAKCFIENPEGLTEVNHKDGNKKNNNVENLEWCTRSENNRHAFKTGLRSYEELKAMAKMPRYTRRKLTSEQVREIRKSNKSDTELSRIYGLCRGAIYLIKKGKTYKEVG